MAIPRNLGNLASGADTNGVLGATKGGTGITSPGASGNILTSNGTAWTSAAPAATGAPIGALQYFQGATTTSYPGSDWLQCNGGVVLQTSYSTLYSRIGLIPNGGASYTFNTPITGFVGDSNSGVNTSFTGLPGIKYLINGTNQTGTLAGGVSTSTDGVTWNNVIISGTSYNISCAKYLNGLYLAGGIGNDGGIYATSTNSITWTPRTRFSAARVNDFIYGTLYVAAVQSTSATGAIFTSTDAITWTARTTSASSPRAALAYNAALTNGKYVAVGPTASNTTAIATSTDGITWTNRTAPAGVSNLYGIASAPALANKYVVVGEGGRLASSADGVSWTERTSGTAQGIRAVAFGAGRYVYCSQSDFGSSTDGVTWSVTSAPGNDFRGITFGDGKFIMSGSGGRVFSSTDGITFSPNFANNYYQLVYNPSANLFVVGGDANGGAASVLRTSTDGTTWTNQTFGSASSIRSIVYGTEYVAVGVGGMLRTSTDAITWTARTSGTVNTITSVAYNPNNVNKYLFTTEANYQATSTDAITWSTTIVPDSGAFCTSANGFYFVWSTSVGSLKVSQSGLTGSWISAVIVATPSSTNTTGNYPTDIIHTGTQYFMCGPNMVGFSEDGIRWIQYPVKFSLSDVVFINGVYFATTAQGIARSYDGLNWNIVFNDTNFETLIGSKNIAASSDAIVVCDSTNVLATSNLFTYNKSTEFALPNSTGVNLATGTETLFIKVT